MILLDSLCRHLLGAYGSTEFATPNLDRFAAGALRFDRHYAGSLPCMPARHDLLVGSLDFLWRPWGSIEVWEEPLTASLRAAGVTTMLVTDHPHLFETGGENYHCEFSAWEYERGHEGDPWRTRPDPSWAGAPDFGRGWMPYDNSRGHFRDEADFPGPRTLSAAARWLDRDAPHHERFLLFVDEFDPHEPFDTPEPYASMYDDGWQGAHLIWPPYVVGAFAKGILDERQARQVRACYGAKLTMIDAWFGRVLDALDRNGLCGRHRRLRHHRSRPLPRREGHLGQAGVADLRAARAHPAAGALAGRRAARGRRAHDRRRSARDAARPLRCAARHTRRTVVRCCRCCAAKRRRCASGRSPASGAAKCT